MLESLFKYSLEADIHRCSSKSLFLKSSQILQESICVAVFFSKVEGPQNCNVIKERLQHRFIREHLFCRGSMNGWFWKTNALFQKQLFLQNISSGCFWQCQTSIMQLYSKGDWAKMFICEICKFFENIFWQNTTYEFWEVFQITSFIKHLSETAYFIYKLPNFNHHIQ